MNRARQTRPNIRSSGNAAPANPSNHPKEKRGKGTPDDSMTKSKENLSSKVKKVRHKAKKMFCDFITSLDFVPVPVGLTLMIIR